MTKLFEYFLNNIKNNLLLERNNLKYAKRLDYSRVSDIIEKQSHSHFVQTFLKEVVEKWSSYHLSPKFLMIQRTKTSDRIYSFEFGNKKEGYRGLGFQNKDTFYVIDLFGNHKDYEKKVMRL